MNNKKIFEVKEEVSIGGVVLEKGDKFSLVESVMQVGEQTISDVCEVVKILSKSIYKKPKHINEFSMPTLFNDLIRLNLASYNGRYSQDDESIDIIASSYKRKAPSSSVIQLIKSLDAYSYQLEGEAEKSALGVAVKELSDFSISLIRGSKEYNGGYWGE